MSDKMWKLSSVCALAAPALVVTLLGSDVSSKPESLVVHEWGTLTSVADERGMPVEWASLPGSADLPCFVDRLGNNVKLSIKYSPGFVRMETPVLYFYPQNHTTLSVHVDFPQGWITEWYPHASAVAPSVPAPVGVFRGGSIQWDSVEASPGQMPQFPLSKGPSHYFAARETDAAALQVGGATEKMLFYRGIGSFRVPLQPKFTPEGKLEIANTGTEAIPLAIVLENREGRLGYRVLRNLSAAVTVDSPDLTASADQLRQELAGDLVEFGLYQKEAQAMIATWRDSWFEEGTRVFYIYPRTEVDSKLPLSVTPKPTSLARVFVGRAEVLSPWMEQGIETAINRGSIEPLVKYGRFLDSFLQQMDRTKYRNLLSDATVQKARNQTQRVLNAGACVK
jgi:hypothetical protein